MNPPKATPASSFADQARFVAKPPWRNREICNDLPLFANGPEGPRPSHTSVSTGLPATPPARPQPPKYATPRRHRPGLPVHAPGDRTSIGAVTNRGRARWASGNRPTRLTAKNRTRTTFRIPSAPLPPPLGSRRRSFPPDPVRQGVAARASGCFCESLTEEGCSAAPR